MSELLAKSGIQHTISVATDYGEQVMREQPLITIHKGRLSSQEMLQYIRKQEFEVVIDATHPYAVIVTKTIRSVVEELKKDGCQVEYFRLEREIQNNIDEDAQNIVSFQSNEACIKELEHISGNILLTTGSKELKDYCQSEELKKRLIVRVLPSEESVRICLEQGLMPQQIVALQGPFSTELNQAIIRQYDIRCMVTKQGGSVGGFPEKMEAAAKEHIPLYMIEKPQSNMNKNEVNQDVGETYSFVELCEKLEALIDVNLTKSRQADMVITLAGIGMGSRNDMTLEVERAIKDADFIAGASRVIAPFSARMEKKAIYMPEDILSWVEEKSKKYAIYDTLQVVILFSGDTGFYSGCEKVRLILEKALQQGSMRGTIRTLPGISSIQTMAAACGISWQNAGIYSIHGRTNKVGWEEELLGEVQRNQNLFLLVSGVADVQKIGRLLQNMMCQIYLGYQLSYPQEDIQCLTPEQCMKVQKEGLYSLMIHNLSKSDPYILTPGMKDDAFIRGKVPMTKEEIREISICKLRLREDSILYDIGSGTGSIAVEAARLSPGLRVYAMEQKTDALELLQKNREQFAVSNMQIVEGSAPETFAELETPTHAFIGGSGGKLFDILRKLQNKNPQMRVVLNAISLETLAELEQIPGQFFVSDFQLVQIQVNRYEKLGRYYMPKAENPITICSFSFQKNGTC